MAVKDKQSLLIAAPMLTKLIPLLGSNHDGEVVATVRAIERTLSGIGNDFHDLAAALTAKAVPVPTAPAAQPRRDYGEAPTWEDLTAHQRAQFLTLIVAKLAMSDWERAFAADCLQRVTASWWEASPKQEAILDRLIGRLWRQERPT